MLVGLVVALHRTGYRALVHGADTVAPVVVIRGNAPRETDQGGAQCTGQLDDLRIHATAVLLDDAVAAPRPRDVDAIQFRIDRAQIAAGIDRDAGKFPIGTGGHPGNGRGGGLALAQVDRIEQGIATVAARLHVQDQQRRRPVRRHVQYRAVVDQFPARILLHQLDLCQRRPLLIDHRQQQPGGCLAGCTEPPADCQRPATERAGVEPLRQVQRKYVVAVTGIRLQAQHRALLGPILGDQRDTPLLQAVAVYQPVRREIALALIESRILEQVALDGRRDRGGAGCQVHQRAESQQEFEQAGQAPQ